MSETKACSFCAKRADEVALLIAGPVAFICDECIMACVGVLTQKVRENMAIAPFPSKAPDTHKVNG